MGYSLVPTYLPTYLLRTHVLVLGRRTDKSSQSRVGLVLLLGWMVGLFPLLLFVCPILRKREWHCSYPRASQQLPFSGCRRGRGRGWQRWAASSEHEEEDAELCWMVPQYDCLAFPLLPSFHQGQESERDQRQRPRRPRRRRRDDGGSGDGAR